MHQLGLCIIQVQGCNGSFLDASHCSSRLHHLHYVLISFVGGPMINAVGQSDSSSNSFLFPRSRYL